MNPLKQKLIDDQSSPLFRIMSVYNDTDAQRRKFDGAIVPEHFADRAEMIAGIKILVRAGLLALRKDEHDHGVVGIAKFTPVHAASDELARGGN